MLTTPYSVITFQMHHSSQSSEACCTYTEFDILWAKICSTYAAYYIFSPYFDKFRILFTFFTRRKHRFREKVPLRTGIPTQLEILCSRQQRFCVRHMALESTRLFPINDRINKHEQICCHFAKITVQDNAAKHTTTAGIISQISTENIDSFFKRSN